MKLVLPILVKDTLLALGELAKAWRSQCPVIGVTGSNGKTTIKEIIRVPIHQKKRVVQKRCTPR